MRSKKTSKIWSWTSKPVAKKLFSTSRMLHLYVSAALFSLLIFFCITGITLNHIDWLSSGEESSTSLSLPAILTPLDELSQLDTAPLALLLNEALGLEKAKEISIDFELGEVTADYSLPAGYAFATWYIYEGTVEIEYQQGSVFAIMNDLHKGRHTGEYWSWLIDISAVFMLLFSFTGLIILFQQLKRRGTGLWLLMWGTATPVLIYLIWVPRIHL
tara:strand:- start:12648 stop:13295 length:648 start_codon:yes stop_codon:yes gene_type:complete